MQACFNKLLERFKRVYFYFASLLLTVFRNINVIEIQSEKRLKLSHISTIDIIVFI